MAFDFLSFLFPARCIGCKKRGGALCKRCMAKIPPAGDVEVRGGMAMFDYGSALVERAIHDMKYYRKSEAVAVLATSGSEQIAEFVADALQSVSPERIIFVPIPQHRRKTRERGFNQSELIAQLFSKSIDGARVERLLEKYRATLPQAHIRNKSARLKNVNDSLRPLRHAEADALYLIVDDVTTTGATFEEARRALRAAGARNILCIALAHGYARKRK
ncbi:MAG TPA: hypothetical protein VG982_00755 [Candidatus Paceibacterota bacterium]|nr:hypothetical protein [Candidatus Paceibacterota bacterium]